jgi:hypothetical protein
MNLSAVTPSMIESPFTAPVPEDAIIQETPLEDPARLLREEGVVIMPEEALPLDEDEWRVLELAMGIPHELVEVGSTQEPHYVRVARLLIPGEGGRRHEHAPAILAVLDKPAMRAVFTRVYGEDLYIPRIQSHLLEPGGFIGVHTDTATDPSWVVACVLHFGTCYTGGTYVQHHPELGDRHYRPKGRALVFARSDLPHQVAPVTSGRRHTMSLFMSRRVEEAQRQSAPAT